MRCLTGSGWGHAGAQVPELPHHPQYRHLGPGEEAKRHEGRAHTTRDVHGEGIAVVEALGVAMPELREAQAAGWPGHADLAAMQVAR